MKLWPRRKFVNRGAIALAGLPLLFPGASTDNNTKKDIIYRTLGKTGLKLPVISMGVMNANNPHLVKAAYDTGIIHFDTAWYYQNGRNEEMVGRALKDYRRDSIVIATKIWEPRDRTTGLFPNSAKARTFVKKFETSLKRLKMKYVDILYLHDISRKESVLFEPFLQCMLKFKEEGKVRFIGVSTHSNEPEVITTAAESNVYDVVLTAYNSRQKHHKEIEKAIDKATRAGLGIIGMKAIAGSVYNIGRNTNVNAGAALKWVLQNKNICTIIAGFQTFDELKDDLSILTDPEIKAEEKALLEKANNFTSLYCQQCKMCLNQCNENLDIPTLMRGYMYASGYKNIDQARQTIKEAGVFSTPCLNCKSCPVICSSGFEIKERIAGLMAINNHI